LIDPFLSGNPKFTGDAAKAAAGATHILLTHGHDDHIGDAANIAKTNKWETPWAIFSEILEIRASRPFG
jgi:L-ascorbate metabolism protein UlaG (beta-lactamase superfamily)